MEKLVFFFLGIHYGLAVCPTVEKGCILAAHSLQGFGYFFVGKLLMYMCQQIKKLSSRII